MVAGEGHEEWMIAEGRREQMGWDREQRDPGRTGLVWEGWANIPLELNKTNK